MCWVFRYEADEVFVLGVHNPRKSEERKPVKIQELCGGGNGMINDGRAWKRLEIWGSKGVAFVIEAEIFLLRRKKMVIPRKTEME